MVEEEFLDYRDDEEFPPHVNRPSVEGNFEEFKEENDYIEDIYQNQEFEM